MRGGSGSSTLRAIIYIDEIFGYMPPHPANPPTKEPLLTLLKQARAFGVGVMLATQNPIDVDYKGLANTGTWMLGRLQTENDRERLMEGMAGAGGAAFNRADMARLLAALPARSFVLHDARESGPKLFASRWAMSYLRGPMTKDDIRRLPEARPARNVDAVAAPSRAGSSSAAAASSSGLAVRPKIADGVAERFVSGGARLHPFLMGTIRLVIEDMLERLPYLGNDFFPCLSAGDIHIRQRPAHDIDQ